MYSLLIIDDEQQIIEGLKAAVHWEDFMITKISQANNFQDALQKAIDEQPDIIIADICIEDKWGFDLVKDLKQLGLNAQFVMMSGYDNFEYIHQSLLTGAKDYLLKPINYLELERIIKKIIIDDLGGEIQNDAVDERTLDPILKREYSDFSKLAKRVFAIIHSEYNKNINLISVADLFKMNNRYIGQAFLSETGMKFSEYLLAYRMMVAKNLIVDTDAKITYIAGQVGYSNTNYFYQHFKSYYGFSPSELRQ